MEVDITGNYMIQNLYLELSGKFLEKVGARHNTILVIKSLTGRSEPSLDSGKLALREIASVES